MTFDIPVIGGDVGTWAAKINAALAQIDRRMIGETTADELLAARDEAVAAAEVAGGPVDIARLPVAASGTSSATQVVRANDTRLSDQRTPTNGSVTTAKIAAAAVTPTELASAAVTGPKLAPDAVTSSKIAAGAVSVPSKLADNVVTTPAIAAGAVTGAKMQDSLGIVYAIDTSAGGHLNLYMRRVGNLVQITVTSIPDMQAQDEVTAVIPDGYRPSTFGSTVAAMPDNPGCHVGVDSSGTLRLTTGPGDGVVGSPAGPTLMFLTPNPWPSSIFGSQVTT